MSKLSTYAFCCVLAALLLIAPAAMADTFTPDPNGDTADPAKFVVEVTKVELVSQSGDYVTIFSGSKNIDLASMAAGDLTDFVNGAAVPPDTYTGARVTLGSRFILRATVPYNGAGTGAYQGVTLGGAMGALVTGRTYTTTSTGGAAGGLASDAGNGQLADLNDNVPDGNKIFTVDFSSPVTVEPGQTKEVSIKMDSNGMAILYRVDTTAGAKVMIVAPKQFNSSTAVVTVN
jgi:hypothetical protein